VISPTKRIAQLTEEVKDLGLRCLIVHGKTTNHTTLAALATNGSCNLVAAGIAFQSLTDLDFSPKIGMMHALGRALRAYKAGQDSSPVRKWIFDRKELATREKDDMDIFLRKIDLNYKAMNRPVATYLVRFGLHMEELNVLESGSTKVTYLT